MDAPFKLNIIDKFTKEHANFLQVGEPSNFNVSLAEEKLGLSIVKLHRKITKVYQAVSQSDKSRHNLELIFARIEAMPVSIYTQKAEIIKKCLHIHTCLSELMPSTKIKIPSTWQKTTEDNAEIQVVKTLEEFANHVCWKTKYESEVIATLKQIQNNKWFIFQVYDTTKNERIPELLKIIFERLNNVSQNEAIIEQSSSFIPEFSEKFPQIPLPFDLNLRIIQVKSTVHLWRKLIESVNWNKMTHENMGSMMVLMNKDITKIIALERNVPSSVSIPQFLADIYEYLKQVKIDNPQAQLDHRVVFVRFCKKYSELDNHPIPKEISHIINKNFFFILGEEQDLLVVKGEFMQALMMDSAFFQGMAYSSCKEGAVLKDPRKGVINIELIDKDDLVFLIEHFYSSQSDLSPKEIDLHETLYLFELCERIQARLATEVFKRILKAKLKNLIFGQHNYLSLVACNQVRKLIAESSEEKQSLIKEVCCDLLENFSIQMINSRSTYYFLLENGSLSSLHPRLTPEILYGFLDILRFAKDCSGPKSRDKFEKFVHFCIYELIKFYIYGSNSSDHNPDELSQVVAIWQQSKIDDQTIMNNRKAKEIKLEDEFVVLESNSVDDLFHDDFVDVKPSNSEGLTLDLSNRYKHPELISKILARLRHFRIKKITLAHSYMNGWDHQYFTEENKALIKKTYPDAEIVFV